MITPQIGNAMATAVTRHNDNAKERETARQHKLTVLKKAIKAMKSKIWSDDGSKILFAGPLYGKKAQIYLKHINGNVNLYLFIDSDSLMKRFTSKAFKVGYFDLLTGFQVSRDATETMYLQWHKEVSQDKKFQIAIR